MPTKMCKTLGEKVPSVSASGQLQWQNAAELSEPYASPSPRHDNRCDQPSLGTALPPSPIFVSSFHLQTLPTLCAKFHDLFSLWRSCLLYLVFCSQSLYHISNWEANSHFTESASNQVQLLLSKLPSHLLSPSFSFADFLVQQGSNKNLAITIFSLSPPLIILLLSLRPIFTTQGLLKGSPGSAHGEHQVPSWP